MAMSANSFVIELPWTWRDGEQWCVLWCEACCVTWCDIGDIGVACVIVVLVCCIGAVSACCTTWLDVIGDLV
jgi:hypothetical protein